MTSFFRIIKFAFQDMSRNFGLSLMTIMILILMLLSINTLLVIRLVTGHATTSIKDKIDFSIYISYEAEDAAVAEVQSYVDSFPEVTELALLSPDESLEQFREAYADSEDVLAALDELDDNPLGPTLVLKTREPGDFKKIIEGLSVPEYESIIDDRTFEETELVIERIEAITSRVEKFTLALSAFFAFIAFLIIFNTIRVAIYTQRREISIKKLVGATNWFIRGPYLVEAIFFSLVSTLAAYAIVYFAVQATDPFVSTVFEQAGLLTNYFSSHILVLLSSQFGAVLLLTVVTSLLAMRKHLRV